jgi:hypothetical protein
VPGFDRCREGCEESSGGLPVAVGCTYELLSVFKDAVSSEGAGTSLDSRAVLGTQEGLCLICSQQL